MVNSKKNKNHDHTPPTALYWDGYPVKPNRHIHTVEQNILITLFNNNNQPQACPAVPINQFPLFLAPQVLLVPLPGPPGPLPRHEEEYVEYGFKLSCKMCEWGMSFVLEHPKHTERGMESVQAGRI